VKNSSGIKSPFWEHMNRHNGLEWTKVQAKLKGNTEKLWSLDEMEVTGGDRMLLVMIKRRMNISFMIVRRKVLKGEEVFVYDHEAWS